jgi:hypothetical protein
MPTPKRFYPTLATVVSTEDLPEVLGFIKDGLSTMLGKIHFKDLQYSKSPKGDPAFYSLSIVSSKRLALEIPSTGINNQDMKSILEVEKIPALSSERETIDYFWVKYMILVWWALDGCIVPQDCKSSGAGFRVSKTDLWLMEY